MSEGPQGRILEALRRRGPLTAHELTEILGGGSAAIRIHLRNLTALGLVAHEEERQPVGRPVRRFALTPRADALFPKHYDVFAVKLAETLAAELGGDALSRILGRWVDELEPYVTAQLDGDRTNALAAHQSSLGFMASLREDGDGGLVLTERNCPLAQVATRFPQICDHEAALFERVLGAPVELECCQARGAAVCEFAVKKPGSKAATADDGHEPSTSHGGTRK